MVGTGDVNVLDVAVLEPVRVRAAAARDLANQSARIADFEVLSGTIADDGVLGAGPGINAHVAHRNNAAIDAPDHAAGAHIPIGILPGGKHIHPRDDCRARRDDRFCGADVGVDRDMA